MPHPVVVKYLPPGVGPEDVRSALNALSAEASWGTEQSTGTAVAHFKTPQEAQEAAKRQDVVLGGNLLHISLQGQPISKSKQDALLADERARTIRVLGIPNSAKDHDVRPMFSNAIRVVLTNGPTITALILFATPEEAQAWAARTDVMVLGCPVGMVVAGDLAALSKRTVVATQCPTGTTEDDLRRVFPNVLTISTTPSPGTFQLGFRTEDEASAVLQAGSLTVGEHTIALMSQEAVHADRNRQVFLPKCPVEATEEDILSIFPKATMERMPKKGETTGGAVRLIFPTPAEALAATGHPVNVCGNTIRPMLHYQADHSVRRRARAEAEAKKATRKAKAKAKAARNPKRERLGLEVRKGRKSRAKVMRPVPGPQHRETRGRWGGGAKGHKRTKAPAAKAQKNPAGSRRQKRHTKKGQSANPPGPSKRGPQSGPAPKGKGTGKGNQEGKQRDTAKKGPQAAAKAQAPRRR